MRTLTLSATHSSYPIMIGEQLLGKAGELLRPFLPSARVIIVSDSHVGAHYAAALHMSLKAAGILAPQVFVDAGEASKSIAGLDGLLQSLLALHPDRKTTLIALGGGVVGDLCGFAASILLRGVPFIQIPTTLLSMVDSAVGGKTGINMPSGKNMVGSFHQPLAVLSDVAVLATLPAREWRAGYAEIAKIGAIMDADFFSWLERHGTDVIAGKTDLLCHAIETACAAKAAIVAEDEHESGRRALLNLGHTFAHAIEAESGYGDKVRHGEAVAVGMVMAARLSHRLNLCTEEIGHRLEAHLSAIGLPTHLGRIPPPPQGWRAELLGAHFLSDKKNDAGTLTFIGLKSIGEAIILRDVSMKDAQAALAL